MITIQARNHRFYGNPEYEAERFTFHVTDVANDELLDRGVLELPALLVGIRIGDVNACRAAGVTWLHDNGFKARVRPEYWQDRKPIGVTMQDSWVFPLSIGGPIPEPHGWLDGPHRNAWTRYGWQIQFSAAQITGAYCNTDNAVYRFAKQWTCSETDTQLQSRLRKMMDLSNAGMRSLKRDSRLVILDRTKLNISQYV